MVSDPRDRSFGPTPVESPVPTSGDASMPNLRPPTRGRPVRLEEVREDARGALFVVSYEDEDYRFEEGSWGRFGRDDGLCQIPVWEELRGQRLSRVAGELWCVEGELWVRNLSESHELVVLSGFGRPQLLPPRTPPHRGAACSVPAPHAVVTAPTTGAWRIAIRQIDPDRSGGHDPEARFRPDTDPLVLPDPNGRDGGDGVLGPTVTSRVGPVPGDLRAVAAALCAPMIEDDAGPATYDGVAARLSITKRQARRYVERLCDHYRDHIALTSQDPDPGRPSYVPVAELLVRRGRVTAADVAALDIPSPTLDRR